MEQKDATSLSAAVDSLNGYNHLASGKVVDHQLRLFIGHIMVAKSEDEVMDQVEKFSTIFAGLDDGFIPRVNWHNRSGLGHSLAKHYDIDENQPFFDIVRTAFLTIAERMFNIAAQHHDDEEEMKRLTDEEINRALAIFTGAADAGRGII